MDVQAILNTAHAAGPVSEDLDEFKSPGVGISVPRRLIDADQVAAVLTETRWHRPSEISS
jgi:hypothetical protein